MEEEMMLDRKNVLTMKLLHYFITEKNYNPIILQGVDNEIWLENLEENCKVVRIVSNYIHNDEQFDFDVFKTKRILKKIKKKTLSFSINVMSIFLDMGENITEDINADPNLMCINVKEEDDIKDSDIVKSVFPDLSKKLKFDENGLDLFMKITGDINEHNKEDAMRLEKVFKSKYPYLTIFLIIVNCIFYFIPFLMGEYNNIINMYCVHGPSIRAGDYYRLLTGMFLHGSLMHLALNCYSIYIIGAQVESFLGKAKFAVIYFFSGITGALLSITLNGSVGSVGASGAIFGLMGALLYFGYYYRVYLGNVVKSQILPLILINLFSGFILPGIDNFAHIGGLVGGVIITIALGIKDKTTTFEKVNGWVIAGIFLAFLLYMGLVVAGN